MTQEELLSKILPPMVEWEVQQIIESGEEFKLSKEKFDPEYDKRCIYGQKFGSAINTKSREFQRLNNIPTLFSEYYEYLHIHNNKSFNCTALEIWCYLLWKKGEKQKIFNVIEQFVTWTDSSVSKEIDYSL